MWNKRREDEQAPSTTPSPTNVSHQPARAEEPAAPAPSRTREPEAKGTASIGRSVVIKGRIVGQEDLFLDGEVEGEVELDGHRLTVGRNGKIKANVKAREIVVLGTIHGDVEAHDKVALGKDAKLVGDIKTASIVVEEGAFFKGSIDIIRPEASRTAAVGTSGHGQHAQASPRPTAAASNATPTRA